jgi:hypothetical protein
VRDGVSATKNLLVSIMFWKKLEQESFKLSKDELSIIATPSAFAEAAIHLFAADRCFVEQAHEAFRIWK